MKQILLMLWMVLPLFAMQKKDDAHDMRRVVEHILQSDRHHDALLQEFGNQRPIELVIPFDCCNDLVETLLAKNVILRTPKSTLLHYAAERNALKNLQSILHTADHRGDEALIMLVNSPDHQEDLPLHCAVRANATHDYFSRLLIDACKNEDAQIPITTYYETILTLLPFTIDPDLYNNEGKTAWSDDHEKHPVIAAIYGYRYAFQALPLLRADQTSHLSRLPHELIPCIHAIIVGQIMYEKEKYIYKLRNYRD